MKKLSFILPVLIILLLFAGCKKMIFSTRVEGKVIDKDTGEPIEGVKIVAKCGSLYIDYVRFPAETTTDSEGKFELKFKAERDWEYIIYASKEPDYPACNPETSDYECMPLYFVELDEGHKNEVVIEMEKYEYPY